jgi:annexin A7/11
MSAAYPQAAYPGYPQQQPFGASSLQPPVAGQYPPGVGGYGAPASQFATPQASPYGAAPAPYGAPASPYPGHPPMPPSPYGHQPPPSPYGAAPYNTALPQSPYPGGYGAAVPTMPSIGYGPSQPIAWDASPDARALRSAMQGFGTNERELIRVLADKDPHQIDAIREAFSTQIRRDLVEDLRKETHGWFQYGLVALARGPLLNDVFMVRDAIDGIGTNEALLNDVLLGRSNADLAMIKDMYQRTFGSNIVGDVAGDLSFKTKRHFDMIMAAQRAEDSEPVMPDRVNMDVDTLYAATEGQIGTDEVRVMEILTYRNDNQIRAISQAYHTKYRRPLEQVIRKEFSGHMQDTLIFQLRHAEDRYMHAAVLLEESMRGLGTKDKLLVSRVVRFHWNRYELENIKGAYRAKMGGTTLAQRIHGETSRDQRRLLLACIGEPYV